MNTSDQINELAGALAKAQGAFANAEKDRENAFFKNRYVTLTSVWDAIRQPLSENGLAIVQVTDTDTDGAVTLITRLIHSSGQYIEATYPVIGLDNRGINAAQAAGSALTYARRYSLSALVGVVADEDDDANAAAGERQPAKAQPQRTVPPQPKPAPTQPTNGQPTPATDPASAAPLPFVMNEKSAIEWAMQTAPQVWPVNADGIIVRDVVKNSFRKLATNDNLHGEVLGRAWVAKIAGKLDDRARAAASTITDAELDGTEEVALF